VKGLVALFGGRVSREQIEEDFFALIDEFVRRQASPDATGNASAGPPAPAVSPADRDSALAYVRAPDLAARIGADLSSLGVIGEERAKLLVYLVATSRKLVRPLSLVVVSRSSAGKSFVVSRTCELMPPEEVLATGGCLPRRCSTTRPTASDTSCS
jgi:hypothetical protein